MAARARERDGASPVMDIPDDPVDDAGVVALLEQHLGAVVLESWVRAADGGWRDTVNGLHRTTAP